VIPRKIDGYEAIKRELGAMGVSAVKTTIPPNWEEFVGMLLFFGTGICALTVHNIPLLIVNLLLSALLSFGWFFVINANPDVLKLPRMRWARFGAFLPVVFAAAGLWFALHG
jgi:protein-S-isoprenylcysteine O-methyltransferase Ste14